MNGRWWIATLALALVLAGCGGDDTVKVEQQKQQPLGPGDTVNNPIPLMPEQPELVHSSAGTDNAFFTVNLPSGLYQIWAVPKPVSPLNDSRMTIATDMGFTQNLIVSNFCCGNSWTPETIIGNLTAPGTIFMRVFAESPTASLTYGLTVLGGVPSGTSIGSGSPTNPAAPQAISAGQTFAASLPGNGVNYYVITASADGRHAVKVTGMTGSPTMWNAMSFNNPGFSQQFGSCFVGFSLPMASCLIDVPAATNIYFAVFESSSTARTYNISVIGP